MNGLTQTLDSAVLGTNVLAYGHYSSSIVCSGCHVCNQIVSREEQNMKTTEGIHMKHSESANKFRISNVKIEEILLKKF